MGDKVISHMRRLQKRLRFEHFVVVGFSETQFGLTCLWYWIFLGLTCLGITCLGITCLGLICLGLCKFWDYLFFPG